MGLWGGVGVGFLSLLAFSEPASEMPTSLEKSDQIQRIREIGCPVRRLKAARVL